ALLCPLARLRLAVSVSLYFALDGITSDLAIIFGGELDALDLTRDRERNLIPLELAIRNCHITALATASRCGQCCCHLVSFELQLKGAFPIRTAISSWCAPCPCARPSGVAVFCLHLLRAY